MATYNGERYLRRQVESILAQLADGDELIVSDDGSTDGTLELLESLADPRLRIMHNSGRHGVNANFDNALRHAGGDYIFLSDQDDVWLPGKVQVCIEQLQEADCVVHDAIVIDSDNSVLCHSFFDSRGSGPGFWKNLYKNTYLGCCMAFRREVCAKALPIPVTKCFYQDNWIGSIADASFRLRFIPFKGIRFQRHTDSASTTARHSRLSFAAQLRNRLVQLLLVTSRLIRPEAK